DALDRVDRHHRPRQVAVELVVDRLPRTGPGTPPAHLGGPRAPRHAPLPAPADDPALRTPSRYSAQRAAIARSGHQNGFSSTAGHSQASRWIACGPICTSAPLIAMPEPSTLRATAPAATRDAVSRAEARPPPR